MIDNLSAIVTDCIEVQEILYQDDKPLIRGTLLVEPSQAFETIAERLKPFNLIPILRVPYRGSHAVGGDYPQKVELLIRRLPEIKRPKSWLNWALLGTTICTTVVAGTFLAGADPFVGAKNLIKGIPFSFTLLLILGSHELGHYFACKLQGIQATLPYFIPVPPPFFPLGTFGAIIRINAPIRDKKGLLKVGAAGPIIGFIMAIPIVIIGLKLSKFELLAPGKEHLLLGNSIIFWGLTKLFTQLPPPGYDLSLHPVAFAGWVGLFVTAINLLPIGQLDGGHISYALFGSKSRFIGLPFVVAMVILGLNWPGWLFWAILILIFIGVRHPPPLNDISPLDSSHKIIGAISLLIFIITFVPTPFKLCL